ncbi:MAG: Hpt domain-containing protein, partial [Herminiimonas sp.]|nr:Hpt domain-containing protein [Herminiimonas sp.]
MHAAGASFDSGPLSWVIGEIRETLDRSRGALIEALAQVDDADTSTASLRRAKTHLHQAHGALQIVDIDGVAILTETAEDLFDRLDAGQLTLDVAMVQAIEHAYQALVEYLEELLSGAAHQPVRLFPYYQALLMARGAERIHPADLFFPNLAIRPKLPPVDAAGAAVPALDYVALRKRFEQALLPFLRSGATVEPNDVKRMHAIIGEVERAQTNAQSRSFWWVMRGFAEAVASGQVGNELYVKQLFARINLQIRRLSEGFSSTAERLLRDALFFIARASDPSPHLQQIRDAYQLDDLVPADYAVKRYGQIDGAALAAARERLGLAKTLWNRIAGGDHAVADGFVHEMQGLSEAGMRLHALPLSKLLRELSGIARAAATGRHGERLGIEMATSLLFVENSLGQIGRLPGNFAERADAMTARLLSIVAGDTVIPDMPWLDDMSREAQQRQTMTALAGELQTSLHHVEKLLEEYFSQPEDNAALAPIDAILHQIGGALSVLDEDDAARAVAHTQTTLRGFAEAGKHPQAAQFEQVARNVGALGFFIETLQLQNDGVRKQFAFDDKTGLFQAKLIDRRGPSSGAVEVDVPALDGPESAATPVAQNSVAVDAPTVEQDLLLHERQAAALARSLRDDHANLHLQAELKASLQQVRRDAALIDHPEANERAKAAMALLDAPGFDAAQAQRLDAVLALTAPTAIAAPSASAAPVMPESVEEVDAELLEIFLTEAVEVLDAVRTTLPAARGEPYNHEHLTTLRRSFHTLKGSGRMVGLMAFGEAAWSIEQVLNLRLSENRGGDADLYALLDLATTTLGAWVDDLQNTGRSGATPDALGAASARIMAGLPFSVPEAVASAPATIDEPIAAPTDADAYSALEPVVAVAS